MSSLQSKLLKEVLITNNKIYEELPEGRSSRHPHRNGEYSYAEAPSPKRSREPVDVNQATGQRPGRKGRPRLYSAQTLQHDETAFVVKIKFNIRNRLAKRLLGVVAPPTASAMSQSDKHSRLARRAVLGKQSKHKSHRKSRWDRDSTTPEYSYESTDFEEPDLPPPTPQASDLPYKGVLPFPECIINNTDPTTADRKLFEKFRALGEQRKEALQRQVASDSASDASATPIPQNATFYYNRSQIEKIQFRDYLIDTWYSSPFPEEFSRSKTLYICEYCLQYMSSPTSYKRHQLKFCNGGRTHPPGTEIYRDTKARIAFWEVDGRKNINYCQNICLLAKLFLNSKTLYYDVEPFVFYVLTEIDEQDSSIYHFVGYFSKEKLNNSDYNVSCILTLPIYQRKGYGSLMIAFSYLLTRKEFKYGTPEKPLSDLGLVSYRNYWKLAMAYTLKRLSDKFFADGRETIPISLDILSKLTGMRPADVVVGLEQLGGLVKSDNSSDYAININLNLISHEIEKWEKKGYTQLEPSCCLWKPLIYGPSGGINSAPALALAPPGNLSQNGTINPVSNSISMITGFLKDDIDNPYTFEEEALKELEHLSKELETQNGGSKLGIQSYHPCLPESSQRAHAPVNAAEAIKFATSEEDANSEDSLDPEFDEVFLDAEDHSVDLESEEANGNANYDKAAEAEEEESDEEADEVSDQIDDGEEEEEEADVEGEADAEEDDEDEDEDEEEEEEEEEDDDDDDLNRHRRRPQRVVVNERRTRLRDRAPQEPEQVLRRSTRRR